MSNLQATRLAPRELQSAHQSGLTPIASDLVGLRTGIVNVFLFGRPQAANSEWALVDGGLGIFAGRIRRMAARRFGRLSRPKAIILTHGHFDHVGALPQLVQEWDVPVYAHELELPYLTGKSSYPPPDPAVGGGSMARPSFLFPRGPIDLGRRVQPLPQDGSVPGMPGWQWVHTPGHTAGHVSLFREEDRVLLAGDAFVTTRQESALAVAMQREVVHRPPAYYTTDWDAARRSVETLAALRPRVAATGHGVPMFGGRLKEGLGSLLRDWNRKAVPAQGRYVCEPAVADESGVVFVPPPVVDWKFMALCAGAVLAATAATLAIKRPKPVERHSHRTM